jgi:hypothetical protein
MGRGINSGLIQIRPGGAQNTRFSVWRPGQQRREQQEENSVPERAERLTAVYAGESPLRETRDADDGRTLARCTEKRK